MISIKSKWVLGVDFGTDSVRAVVVNAVTGEIKGEGISYYKRWKAGKYQHPEKRIYCQHPLDYLESLEQCIVRATERLSENEKSKIVGIGIDTTGSTPAPVNELGIPLALMEAFSETEDAMFRLWKDHSAVEEAGELNELFQRSSDVDFCKYQGEYSSEWFWAKILHTVRKNPLIKKYAYTWVEHCDWIVGVLCGNTIPEKMYHSACAAGHKALFHSEWEGLPPETLLAKADPYLAQVRKCFGKKPEAAMVKAGMLTEEWAKRLKLSEGIIVSGSSFDAHAGAVGAGIDEQVLVCTLGTSAVDMFVVKPEYIRGKDVRSFGGQAENSILPGYIGIETGQAAFGDIFAWYKNLLMWPMRKCDEILKDEEYSTFLNGMEEKMLFLLEKDAEKIDEGVLPVALDWFNGRRYPCTDDRQKSTISGLTLGVNAVSFYKSLVFGAVCGLKRICEGYEKAGIVIKQVKATGGISVRSKFTMQMMADILEKEISVVNVEQTCALGAAIYAAVASGCYEKPEEAVKNMSAVTKWIYKPNADKIECYRKHYEEYLKLAQKMEIQSSEEAKTK